MSNKKPRSVRFWEKVDRNGENGCWNWIGAINGGGAPIFCYTETKMVQAHRYVFEEMYDYVIDRSVFIHRLCGNSRCVNPAHLEVQDEKTRFWSFVNKIPNGCWIWTGSTDKPGGYGQFRILGENYPAHRYSYELHKGKIPEGMFILHSCHNRSCVNPNHLRVGTREENMKDMTDAGRQARGHDQGLSKLETEQVYQIRACIEEGFSTHLLAEKFGVSDSTICDIKAGRTWSWLK